MIGNYDIEHLGAFLGSIAAFITSMVSCYISLKNAVKLDNVHDTQKDTHETLANMVSTVTNVVSTVNDVKESVKNVEVQTNHLTSALVEKTAEISHAAGVADEKERAAAAVPLTTMEIEALKQSKLGDKS